MEGGNQIVSDLLPILIRTVLITNIILTMYIGLCPFFGVSKKLGPAISMGIAVIFVMSLASLVTWIINTYVLIPFDVEFMRIVIYILVIATAVQMVEMFIKRTTATLYNALGIYLPLITTNCAVLAVTFINTNEGYNLLQSMVCAFGTGLGFALVLVLMSSIREKLELADLPESMKGLPIAFLVAMLLALAFFGFGGMA